MIDFPNGRVAIAGLLLAALPIVFSAPGQAEDLSVAVAANFYATLQELAPAFERATKDKLLLSPGSSGQLYAQIKQGAPFDVMLSADNERPKFLESEGLAVAGSRCTYAVGTLVLWSPQSQAVDDAGKVLLSGHYRMIGMADPQSAPYGAAAEQVLKSIGIWDQLNREKKLVFGENVQQAWQFASTGSADMAFVSLSQVTDGKIVSGSYWIPSPSLYAAIDQDAVILKRTAKRQTAERFLLWLREDPQAIAIIKAAGYRIKP